MFTRVIAIPAATVVLGLIAAAMFGNGKSGARAADPHSVIQPGQQSPHEERGLCVACHLIGGPSAKDLAAANATTATASAAAKGTTVQAWSGGGAKVAPAIYPDQVRPHGEWGACTGCHNIIVVSQGGAGGAFTANPGGPLPPANALSAGAQFQGYVAQGVPGGVPVQVPQWYAGQNPIGAGAMAMAAPWGLLAGQLGGMAQGQQAQGRAPPVIVDGMKPPHDWRGQCVSCHMVLSPQMLAQWQTSGAAAAIQPQGTWAPNPAAIPSQVQSWGPSASPPGAAWAGGDNAGWGPGRGSGLGWGRGWGAANGAPCPQGLIGQGQAMPPAAASPFVPSPAIPPSPGLQATVPVAVPQVPVVPSPSPSFQLPQVATAFPQQPQGVGPRNPEAEALGMSVRPTSGDVQGLLVVEVEGLSRRAGLELGDIIRGVDGQITVNLDAFLRAVKAGDPTRGIILDVVRSGKGMVVVLR